MPTPTPTPPPTPIPDPLPDPIPDPLPDPIPEPDTFIGKHGFLKVKGSQIVDQHDKPIQLVGMSLFWSQWAQGFYNHSAIYTIAKEWKATVVRAAMGIEMGGYLSSPEHQTALVENVIDAAIKEDIYVIIDWHDHNAQNHEKQAKEFFGGMAEKYKDTPNVIFELFNEPVGIPWSRIKSYAEAVTEEIRSKGAQNLIIVGTPTWSQDVDAAANSPVSDPNVAYALHFYASSHKQSLRDKAAYALSKNIALFVTEFGTTEASGNGYVDLNETEIWMKFMRDNSISWANWSLFDKNESSSALRPNVNPFGPWNDNELTKSGRYIRDSILKANAL